MEVLTKAPGAVTFTTDGKDLFWSDGHALTTRAVAPDAAGGEPTRLVRDASPASEVRLLEVEGEQLYFAAAKDFDRGCLGLVGVVPRAGGPVEKVGPAGCPESLSVTKDRVLFIHRGTDPMGGNIVSTLYSAPREKGGKTIVLKRGFNGTGHVSAHGDVAYFPVDIGAIARIPILDGPTTQVVGREVTTGVDSVDGDNFAVDEDNLFFFVGHLNISGLRVARMSKSGGTLTELGTALPPTERGEGYPKSRIRLSKSHVVWSHPLTGTVSRVDKEGQCAVERVAEGRVSPDWATPAGDYIYWLEGKGAETQIARVRVEK